MNVKKARKNMMNIMRRHNMGKKIILIITVVLFLTTLAGCQTMHGFGKDLKKLGNKIEKKADK